MWHSQVAVIAGNLDLAEVIKNYKAEEVGECGPTVLHGFDWCFIYTLYENVSGNTNIDRPYIFSNKVGFC